MFYELSPNHSYALRLSANAGQQKNQTNKPKQKMSTRNCTPTATSEAHDFITVPGTHVLWTGQLAEWSSQALAPEATVGVAAQPSSRFRFGAGKRKFLAVLKQKSVIPALLAVFVATAIPPTYAEPGDQKIIRDVVAAKGWTSIVPMNINDDGLTDFLSYNAETGQAVFSVGIGNAGDQKVVRDVAAAKGWTSIVPMNIDSTGLNDLLSYNAATGHAVFSVGIGKAGDQKVVRDVVAAKGWTSIVPMNINDDGLTDFLSYNAETGQAVFSVGIGNAGDQKVVRDVAAAKGWTSIVPMNIDNDLGGLTDLLSYNAATGHAVFSVGISKAGDQKVVRDVAAARGWTSIVPMDLNGFPPTDLLSYNAETGQAVFSVGIGNAGDQKVVRDVAAAKGWTSIVPTENAINLTGLLSYNAKTGQAVFSIATDPIPPH
jgi:hypothetical protein